MASDTWQNGGVDLHWATAGNWVGGGVPGTGDTATFNNAGLDLPDTGPGGGTVSVTLTAAFSIDPITDLFHDDGTLLGTLTVSANTTLTDSFSAVGLALTAGILTGASKTITVGATSFVMSGTASIAGTFTVNLSAGAGAYTQTAGTINADAVLNVTTGSGGFSAAAITLTGTAQVNVTQAVSSSAIEWAIASPYLSHFTVNSGVTATLSGNLKMVKCTNNGIIAALTRYVWVFPAANDFWSGSGTLSGTSTDSLFSLSASYTNAGPIIWGSTTPCKISTSASGSILTASGGFTCGDILLQGPNTAGQWVGLTLPNGASLSCANLVLGDAASNRSGKVVLGTGVHRISGNISNPGSAQVSAFTLGGRLILGGTLTGTGITVTPTYEGQIDCQGKGVVTNVTATGNRLVVRRAVTAAGMPLRSWQGGTSNVNVRFLGRRVIGEWGMGAAA